MTNPTASLSPLSLPAQSPPLYQLDRTDGQYLLSAYGSSLAFGWYGSPEFRELTESLIENYSFIGPLASVHRYKYDDSIFYIVTDEKKLRAALGRFFTAQIKVREVRPTWSDGVLDNEDEEGKGDSEGTLAWDEQRVEVLVAERLNHFLDRFVKKERFLLDSGQGAA